MHLQVKSKHGAFYKAMPLIDFLEDCFFGGRNRGGGDRGGHRGGGRGGYGRAETNDTITNARFWNPRTFKEAEKYCKGLKVK